MSARGTLGSMNDPEARAWLIDDSNSDNNLGCVLIVVDKLDRIWELRVDNQILSATVHPEFRCCFLLCVVGASISFFKCVDLFFKVCSASCVAPMLRLAFCVGRI